MKRVVIQYKVKPEQAEHNLELIRAFYDELERTQPEGLGHAVLRLADGVTFIHISEETEEAEGRLGARKLPALRGRDRGSLRGPARRAGVQRSGVVSAVRVLVADKGDPTMTARSEEIKGIDVEVERDGSTMHVESASRWPQRDQSHTAASIIADVLARGS